jgi:LuxR family maltose regulon positive regulatory protein
MAAPCGFMRLFLDEGQVIKNLLHSLRSRSGSMDYIDRLLDAFGDVYSAKEIEAQPLVEPLSKRELDVLRLLPTNLTTPEIAAEMVIGVNTVRTHIKNIYSKLQVHKRTEAVRRAQELGLLS